MVETYHERKLSHEHYHDTKEYENMTPKVKFGSSRVVINYICSTVIHNIIQINIKIPFNKYYDVRHGTLTFPWLCFPAKMLAYLTEQMSDKGCKAGMEVCVGQQLVESCNTVVHSRPNSVVCFILKGLQHLQYLNSTSVSSLNLNETRGTVS